MQRLNIYTPTIEKCKDTGLYVGFINEVSGAHSQAESLDKLTQNLKEVIDMLLDDNDGH